MAVFGFKDTADRYVIVSPTGDNTTLDAEEASKFPTMEQALSVLQQHALNTASAIFIKSLVVWDEIQTQELVT